MKKTLCILFLFAGTAWSLAVTAQTIIPGGPFCPVTSPVPLRPVVTQDLEPEDVYLTGDRAEYTEGGLSHLLGNAEVVHDQQQVTADRIDYDQSRETVDLLGDVKYWDSEVYLSSPRAHLDLATDSGSFSDVNYWLLGNRGRGSARQVHVEAGTSTRGTRVDYTTCDPEAGSPWNLTTNIWELSARELIIDHEAERGTGKHVVLKIKDIPVFYSPYLSFPTSDNRKSGFLIPGFGSSGGYGFEFQAPYYWNIAPQMDATITPRLMSKTGVMMMGEYRYLFERGGGAVNVEYLPNDQVYGGEDRSLVSVEHVQSFLDNGRLALSYNRVSDREYLEDFSNSLTGTSTRFLEQRAIASYSWNLAGHRLGVSGAVENYQIVDRFIVGEFIPYKRLPSMSLDYASPYRNGEISYAVNGRLDYFRRGSEVVGGVDGLRYDFSPTVSLPVNRLAWFAVPKAGMRLTRYHLDDNDIFGDDDPGRFLPFLSLDSGIFLERDTYLFGESMLQTLEPRFYYLYVPDKDQSDLPVFDTIRYSPSFSSLFYDNRFSGPDRFGDANQVSLAVTSRLFSASTGSQLGYLSVGQAFHLDDREVSLPGETVREGAYSTIITEAGTTLFNDLNLRGEFQWDPDTDSTRKLTLNAQYLPGGNRVINLGYRINRYIPYGTQVNALAVEQTDVSFSWPVTSAWSVVGRWNYAPADNKSLDLFGGVEYNSCCWSVRAVARRFVATLGDEEFQTGVFLQFELKGLAGIGEKTVDFLVESIPGYQREF